MEKPDVKNRMKSLNKQVSCHICLQSKDLVLWIDLLIEAYATAAHDVAYTDRYLLVPG
jgi:hypothetical protein